jgi:hypothetical protein
MTRGYKTMLAATEELKAMNGDAERQARGR